MIDEANKYALFLGYNYQSSQWYEASYKILNKNYKRKEINNKDKGNKILDNFKKIFK